MRFKPALFVTAFAVVALLGVFGPFSAATTSLTIIGLSGLAIVLAMLVLALVGNVWTLTLVVPLGLLLASFWAVRTPRAAHLERCLGLLGTILGKHF